MKEMEKYMARAVQLARLGAGFTSPNPMVGCVIAAPDGRIIGEGFHRLYGSGHAEVNAVASVAEEDRRLFPESTAYVTLEPCSHYGKTPPCAKLLVDSGIGRVVVGSLDPNEKVSGRGVEMLRQAGIEVVVGVLEEKCRALNPRFLTAHTLGRPWVQLKWARSADGFISAADGSPVRLSNPLSLARMHAERAMSDAIMVGTTTANTDNPSLTVRLRPARRNPLRVTFNRRGALDPASSLASDPEALVLTADEPLAETLRRLRADHGVTSLMVEGGAALLQSFIDEGLWDEIRVETAPLRLGSGIPGPAVPQGACLEKTERIRGSEVAVYSHIRKNL